MWFGKKGKMRKPEGVELEELKMDLAQFLMMRGCMSTDAAVKASDDTLKRWKNKLWEVC